MRRRAALQPSLKSVAAHLASLNTCRLFGGRTFKVNHHAPAADAPAIPQKSGGAFGIPEYMPPNRRQDFQSKPPCRAMPGTTINETLKTAGW